MGIKTENITGKKILATPPKEIKAKVKAIENQYLNGYGRLLVN